MFNVDFNDSEFQRAMRNYIKYNQRDVGALVENQARKVILGVGGKGGVDGIKQLAKKYRATKSKIRQDMKPLLAGFIHDGGRGKKRFITFKNKNGKAKFVGAKKAELQRRQKFSGFTSKSMAMPWKPAKLGRNVTIKPYLKVYMKVIVATKGMNPYVRFRATNMALVQMEKDHSITQRALRNGARDMYEYIERKVAEKWEKN